MGEKDVDEHYIEMKDSVVKPDVNQSAPLDGITVTEMVRILSPKFGILF